MIVFFSVHCSKKKGGGLGLGILALAGGGGSSSSSSGDSTDKPKDDPKNDPEFDEVKQKIEQSIKFPTQNENKVLKNNNDYKAVDLSITGEFFQDLKNLKDLEVEHQVFAGDEETTATTISITESFITNQKIPLVLDLSSLQPDTGFTQPKLKLKFSSEKKQIISKEWAQNFVLEGKKQTPSFSYTDRNNKEKSFQEPFVQDNDIDSSNPIPIKVSSPTNIPKNLEIRMEAMTKKWDTYEDKNTTFFPSLTPPNNAAEAQASKEGLTLENGKTHTIVSQLFYRFKGTKIWHPSKEPLTNYYNLVYNNSVDNVYPTTRVNKLFFKRGEKMTLTFTLPSEVTNDKAQAMVFTITSKTSGGPKFIYVILGDGSLQAAGVDTTVRNKFIKTIDYNPDPTDPKLKPNKDYTFVFDWQDNLNETFLFQLDLRLNTGSGLTKEPVDFRLHLDTLDTD